MTKHKILCLIKGRERFIKPIMSNPKFEIIIEDNWDDCIIENYQPDLIISIGESHFSVFKCFQKAKLLHIPTLNIQDGIHEWRDIWENDNYSLGGNYFNRNFIIADKILCIGQLQANWYYASGMVGQPEVVGLPWLEDFTNKGKTWVKRNGQKKILIMTANTPAFNIDQYNKVLNSIKDLRDIINTLDNCQPIWRVKGKISEDLGLVVDQTSYNLPLHTVLQDVDAVISTPSTAILEAMITGIPTAIIDYTNSPQYINAAWNITNRNQILPVLNEIISPLESKLHFQNMLINIMVDLRPNATNRMSELMEKMIEYGKLARSQKKSLILPQQILISQDIHVLPVEINKKNLFPFHSVFYNDDILSLQLQNINLMQEIKILKQKLMFSSIYYDIKKVLKLTVKKIRILF